MIVHQKYPLNAGPALDRLHQSFITLGEDFFVRTHGTTLTIQSLVLSLENQEGDTSMTTIRTRISKEGFLPTEASISSRKVSRSGHVSYQGQPYFISKSLAGRYIRVVEFAGRLIIDASIPVYKEYSLVK